MYTFQLWREACVALYYYAVILFRRVQAHANSVLASSLILYKREQFRKPLTLLNVCRLKWRTSPRCHHMNWEELRLVLLWGTEVASNASEKATREVVSNSSQKYSWPVPVLPGLGAQPTHTHIHTCMHTHSSQRRNSSIELLILSINAHQLSSVFTFSTLGSWFFCNSLQFYDSLQFSSVHVEDTNLFKNDAQTST